MIQYLQLENLELIMNSIAGVAALRSHGAGVSSVRWTVFYYWYTNMGLEALTFKTFLPRFICGTQNIHKQLEEKIARFKDQEVSNI